MAQGPTTISNDPELRFLYRNYRGEIGDRRLTGPFTVWHGKSEWHEGDQFFITAWDLDKDAIRDFALEGIVEFHTETPLSHLRPSNAVSPGLAVIVQRDGVVRYIGPINTVPHESTIPHGAVINLNPVDFGRISKAAREAKGPTK